MLFRDANDKIQRIKTSHFQRFPGYKRFKKRKAMEHRRRAVSTARAEARKGTICGLRTLSVSEVRNCRPAVPLFPGTEKNQTAQSRFIGVNFPQDCTAGNAKENIEKILYLCV